jgi:hypothetical protein
MDTRGGSMKTEMSTGEPNEGPMKMKVQGGSGDTVYGLGLIGAWIYYIGRADNFQEGVMGFLKGLVWPAFVVYGLLKLLDKD